MNEIPITLNVAMTEARSVADNTAGDITAKLKAAMQCTANHWLVTAEDDRFTSAVCGVMLCYGEGSPEFMRLNNELNDLQSLGRMLEAAATGGAIDFDAMAKLITPDGERIGLMAMWREIKQ